MSGRYPNLPETLSLRRCSGAKPRYSDATDPAMGTPKKMLLLSMSMFAVSGCANTNTCAGHDPSPEGEVSEYELRAGGSVRGVSVAPLLRCEHDRAYIRLERASGARRLRTAGGCGEECTELPDLAEDPSQCPVIDYGAILRAAFDEMLERGLGPNRRGAGPCADTTTSDYESSNMAVGVVHWSNADEAVNIVAGLLEEYDLSGFIGVAVRGYGCAEAD